MFGLTRGAGGTVREGHPKPCDSICCLCNSDVVGSERAKVPCMCNTHTHVQTYLVRSAFVVTVIVIMIMIIITV